jgi:hypothetical protein
MTGAPLGAQGGKIGDAQIAEYGAKRFIERPDGRQRPESRPHPGAATPPAGMEEDRFGRFAFLRDVASLIARIA